MKKLLFTFPFLLLLVVAVYFEAAAIYRNYTPAFVKPDLTATGYDESVVITFTDKSNDDSYYKLYRIDENGSVSFVYDFPGNQFGTEQMIDEGVPSGVHVTYYVDAVLLNGAILPRVAESSTATHLYSPLFTQENYPECGNTIDLEYDARNYGNVSGLKVEIYRSQSHDTGYSLIATQNVSNNGQYFDHPKPRNTYYYKLRSVRGDIVSEFSEVKQKTALSNWYQPTYSGKIVGDHIEITLQDRSYAESDYWINRISDDGAATFPIVMSDSGRTFTLIDTTVILERPYAYELNASTIEHCLEGYEWPNRGSGNSFIGEIVIPIPSAPPCTGAGSITRELWKNVTGVNVTDIPVNTTPTSVSTITTFETPNYAGNNYGARIRGYVCVPQSGYYTFWISSDDKSQLWLSTDNNPTNKRLIASVDSYTPFRNYDKYPSQKSEPILLSGGMKYYIEALHKEGDGADHLSVGWRLPNGTLERPISGNRLIPYNIQNQKPVVMFTSPTEGQHFSAPANIKFTANAVDKDGTIKAVYFSVVGIKPFVADTIAPYEFTWSTNVPGSYVVKAIAVDNKGDESQTQVNIVVDESCGQTGSLSWDIWTGIAGTSISSIPVTSTPNLQKSISIFETPSYWGNDYGARTRGYLCIPASGSYIFWIASDDASELWLSTDDNPANKVKIAFVNGYTAPRQWTKYTSQQSAPISLLAGHKYYVEVLHKEANGNDHISVGWQLPNGTLERPIPGSRLIPFNTGTHSAGNARVNTSIEPPAITAETEGIFLYPNPTLDRKVNLKISVNQAAELEGALIQVVSTTGGVVHEQQVNCKDDCQDVLLNLDAKVNTGVYVVNVIMKRKRFSKKLIIN